MDYSGVWFDRSIIAIIAPPESAYHMEYFLGLFNSRYFLWLYRELVQETGRVFAQVKLSKVNQLPIRVIDFSNAGEKAAHDDMVSKVEKMLDAKKRLTEAKNAKDKSYYENKCAALDRQIDRLVYELYGLSEAEIQTVERRR